MTAAPRHTADEAAALAALEGGDAKRRRDPEARPQQIIEAAFVEFAEHGLSGCRLDDVARRAGVAKGTIYLYFPSKEALFREMVRTTTIAALEQAESRLADTETLSADSQLRAVASGWWASLRKERVQVIQRLVTAELSQFPELMQFYADAVITRGRRLIATIITRGVARGEFREIDPETAARMLSALSMSHAMWCSKRQFFPGLDRRSDDDVRDEIIDFYLHALRPIPAAAPTSSASPL
jgi:AcrR family transcriptional regulator